MSKKSIRQKKPSRVIRKRYGLGIAKIADIFSLLSAAIVGLWKKLWHIAMGVTGKIKEDAIGLPGPAYVFGSAPTTASDIASLYDKAAYPNIYSSPTNHDMPLDNSLWPAWIDNTGDTYSNNPLIASYLGIDGRTAQGTIDDYWVNDDSPAPDPDSNDE